MSHEHDRRPQPPRTSLAAPQRDDERAVGLHRLQATAGNRAVAQLLAAHDRTTGHRPPLAPVQRNAKFDLAVGTAFDKADAPQSMAVPDELREGLEAAWAASFPEGKSMEQGGILVKTKDGAYVWRAGKATGSGSFKVNYADVGPDEVLVASGHTHPYDESEGGHTDIAFSGGDLSNLVWQQERFKLVQSGTAQFGVAKTAEFDALVAAADTKDKKTALRQEMNALWDSTFKGSKGKFPERVETAARAVCDKYHLVYYAGSKGAVAQPKAKTKAHVESPVPSIPKTPTALPPVEGAPTTGTGTGTATPQEKGLLARVWDWLSRLGTG